MVTAIRRAVSRVINNSVVMVSILYHMVSIDEIQDRIAELHKQRKTTREIAKDVRKNLTFVGSVLKKRFPEEYVNDVTINKETQALHLFSIKKTPTQVAIKLRLSTEETEKFYKNFWRLEGLYELYNIYRENRNTIPNLLRVHKLLKKKGIPVNDYNLVFDLISKEKCRREDQVLRSDNHIYSLDEIEKDLASADGLSRLSHRNKSI